MARTKAVPEKRSREEDPVPQTKKRRIEKQISALQQLLAISDDELGYIQSFLRPGEALMLAISCKSLFNRLTGIAKAKTPFVIDEPWSLSKALRLGVSAHIVEPVGLQQLKAYAAAHANQLPSQRLIFTRKMYSDGPDITVLTELLSTPLKKSPPHSNVEALKLPKRPREVAEKKGVENDDEPIDYEIEPEGVTIKTRDAVVGDVLRHLVVNSITPTNFEEICQLLASCMNLESLTLKHIDWKYEMRAMMAGRTEDFVQVPILKNLKKLVVDHLFDFDSGLYHLPYLLKLTPNLEELKGVFDVSVNSRLLEYLVKTCPKLRKLCIQSSNDSTPNPNSITDDAVLQFLSAVPTISELKLSHCDEISGKLLIELGAHAPNLEVLSIERYIPNCDEQPEIYLGGGVLPKLKRLELHGNFTNLENTRFYELSKTAPNIEFVNLSNLVFKPLPGVDAKLLENCPTLKQVEMGNVSEESLNALKHKKGLVSIYIAHRDYMQPFKVDAEFLRQCGDNWKQVTSFTYHGGINVNWKELLEQLAIACPNLRKLNVDAEAEELLPIVQDTTIWPDLLACPLNYQDLLRIGRLNCRSLFTSEYKTTVTEAKPSAACFAQQWLCYLLFRPSDDNDEEY